MVPRCNSKVVLVESRVEANYMYGNKKFSVYDIQFICLYVLFKPSSKVQVCLRRGMSKLT